MNPYFSRAEYAQRYDRAADLMKARGLSALFVTSDRNLYYLSGCQPFPSSSLTRPALLIAPVQGNPMLVTGEFLKESVARDSWIDHIQGYTEVTGVPTEMVASLFRELGLEHASVGAEFGREQRLGMPLADFLRLQDALPDVQWVDAADVFWQLRMIKSQSEIECMRKSCSATMHAFSTVFPKLGPGFTREQVVHMLQSAICDDGADFGFTLATWDRETNEAMGSLPSGEPIEKGDMVWIDLGAVYHGYWSDFSRAVSLGHPSDDTLRVWEAIHYVTMKGVQTVRPGATIGQVVHACMAESERRGLDLNLALGAGRMGHGVGLNLTEPPNVSFGETTVLQRGMTITVEPGIVGPSGVFIIEQNVAVTEDGVDVLSEGPWEIWTV